MITNQRKYFKYKQRLAKVRSVKQRTAFLIGQMNLADGNLLASIDAEIAEIAENLTSFEDRCIDLELLSKISAFPKMLLALRLSIGWSQEDLARETRMTRKQIGKFEREGYDSARLKVALSIASTLYQAFLNAQTRSQIKGSE